VARTFKSEWIAITHHQVDVRRSHGMPVNSLQELPRRTVFGERVGGGAEAVEAVLALVVGLELAAQVVVAEGRVLEVVLAVTAGLPHVEGDVGDGLVGDEVADHAVHVGDLALVVVLDDRVAELAPGGVGGPEGAEDGGGSGVVVGVVGLDVVCDFGDEAGGIVSKLELRRQWNAIQLTIQDRRGRTFCASRCACRWTRPTSCQPR
jgi:hypothetical protein